MSDNLPVPRDEGEVTREEKIELLTNALWNISEEKLDVIAAVIDL